MASARPSWVENTHDFLRLLAAAEDFRRFGETHIPHAQRVPTLSPEETFLLARINGVWTIGGLVQISPLKEVDTLASIRKLQDRGLVAIRHGS